ncbi:MAG: adenosine kinase [Prevotellaceae bacterium]|nr:adenosine kinase [Prevotellaceae bacterium]
MDKIIGMGNALTDVLVTLKDDRILCELALPKGSMTLIDELKLKQVHRCLEGMTTQLAAGGSAGNTIRSLAWLDTQTGFIGKIGDDEYGQFYASGLKQRKIQVHLSVDTGATSGVASTFISPGGERTFATYLGASQLKAEDFTPELFDGYTYLYIEGYMVQDHEMILHAIALAKEAGLIVCIDLASYNIVEQDRDFFRFLIENYVDIVFANEEEARAFTGKPAREATDEIASMCSIAVVKARTEGAFIRRGTEVLQVEAPPVPQVIDTTGAGDYFAAGFLYGLLHGCSMRKCGQAGSLLAGYIIQVIGAELPEAYWDEIKMKINKL